MVLNLPSRIITSILLPDLETYLTKNFNFSDYAVSPLTEHDDKYFDYEYLYGLKLQILRKTIYIHLYSEGPAEETKEKIIRFMSEKLYYIKIILNFIFRHNLKVDLIKKTSSKFTLKGLNRIDLSFTGANTNFYFTLLLPQDFLNLFPDKNENTNRESTENKIITFFTNPINLLPDLSIILNSLNETEIQRLFYHLQNKNLLSPYQISIVLLSFPQYNDLIRNNLSKNIAKDVNTIIRKTNFNKRDLIGGIYSIEEAVYQLMKRNEDFYYSKFISQIMGKIKMIQNARTLTSKNFYNWIKEIKKTGQLYQTISITKEEEITNAISGESDLYFNIFSSAISKKKLKDIFSKTNTEDVSVFKRMEAQVKFISNFKKLKIKKLNLGHENFPALLTKIEKEEISYLLLGVGWYVLSTAFKGMNKNKIISKIDKIPLGAKYLIVDVLQGIINPNIIHDEIQINKARKTCVDELSSLYEDGLINLL